MIVRVITTMMANLPVALPLYVDLSIFILQCPEIRRTEELFPQRCTV